MAEAFVVYCCVEQKFSLREDGRVMNQNTLPDVSMDEIIEIVRGTKKILLDAEARSHIHQKGPADFVTEVDFMCRSTCRRSLPGDIRRSSLWGEEKDNRDLDPDGALWILDPVDGTTNLIHQYRQSAVSLGLSVGRRILAAVIYNPYSEEIFSARAGEGASATGSLCR